MYVLENLEPKQVFRFFEELSRIPRGSGNEQEVSDYLVKFGKDRGLEVIQDKALNVIIKKPSTKGYEKAPTVIMQGHMDMVNEKNADTVHDFEKDPIKLIIEGDWIKAAGTTLGADNAVALALAMAALDSDQISHPPLEVLFTTDEEVGMFGANAVDPSLFTAKRLLNLDVGPEGYFFAGCSGGLRQRIYIPITYVKAPAAYKGYTLKIRGLKGGHSGALIHTELGNSNKLLGRTLYEINKKHTIEIAHVSGGSKENAIPREADAVICVPQNEYEALLGTIKNVDTVLKNEYRVSDPGVTISLEECDTPKTVFSKETKDKMIKAYLLIPYGLIAKSLDIEGLTETSTNLGVVETLENEIMFTSASRSSVSTRKLYMMQQFTALAELLGARLEQTGEYPAWEFNPKSELWDITMAVYEKIFGEKPELTATHGGLECGLFCEKMPGIDIVAFGPTAEGAHTPDEKLSISSMERTWKFVVELLKALDK